MSNKTIVCCFKFCKELTTSFTRIEVKSAIPTNGLSKYKESLVVKWKANGEAFFHKICWDTLTDAAGEKKRKKTRQRTKEESTNRPTNKSFEITESEKAMIRQANETAERFDSEDQIVAEAKRAVQLMKASQSCVFFTGAGISTAAGLGDFRGKGGKWTEQDREAINMDANFINLDESADGPTHSKRARSAGIKNGSTENELKKKEKDKISDNNNEEESDEEEIDYEQLRPTLTHECITKLMDLGLVKYLVTQNCDGLHRLSGTKEDMISELHGNVFVEKCEKCGRRYERPYYVCDDVSDIYLEEKAQFGKSDVIFPKFMKKCRKCGLSHRTGRYCSKQDCNSFLMDTIINFRDNLEDEILDRAFEHAKSCDLLICLGTTLTVTPASSIVEMIKHPQRVFICNRQPTEYDRLSEMTDKDGTQLGGRVYGDSDVFMKHVMVELLGQQQTDNFINNLMNKTESYNELRANKQI